MSKARKLLKGRYYWHRDASVKGMHPSYIYKKNDKKNKGCKADNSSYDELLDKMMQKILADG